jgi:hypothetical protein
MYKEPTNIRRSARGDKQVKHVCLDTQGQEHTEPLPRAQRIQQEDNRRPKRTKHAPQRYTPQRKRSKTVLTSSPSRSKSAGDQDEESDDSDQ